MTFIAGLRQDRIYAPWMLDGAMDATAFKTYLHQVRLPTLSKDDVVIMDNLPAHKVAGARDIVESIGAKVLCLPPYSPDFNPNEQVFTKLKTFLRKAAERTVDGLFNRIGEILKHFESPECNY